MSNSHLSEERETITNAHGRNDRFEYAKILRGQNVLFLKRALNPSLRLNIQREKLWAEFMNYVVSHYPDAHLKGPVIREHVDADTILFDYINASHLSVVATLEPWEANMLRYAAMLNTLDLAAENWTADTVIDAPPRSERMFATWDKWLGMNKDRFLRLAEVRQLVENNQPYMVTRMQHGDLTPWQIFDDGQTWIIYDGEQSGIDLYRYNDLAYGYGRLWTLLRSPDAAADLLRAFLEVSQTPCDEFFKQFLPVVTARAVGMLADAYNDALNNDYVEYANSLLNTCLNQELEPFLAPSHLPN